MTYLNSIEVFNGQMGNVEYVRIDDAEICYFNRPNPQRKDENHDSLWIANPIQKQYLLSIADGAGGHRSPAEASANLLAQLKQFLENQDLSLDNIIHGIESANDYVRNHFNQSRSTLMIALIYDQSIRTLHVGDSKLVIIGGRGKLKYETIGHNLFEISTDSGLIDYINAEVEVPSNVVTNMIGDSHFRLDLSTKMELAPNDTVLLGSDGLYDNIGMDEICELCKLSSTLEIASAIQARCNERMNNPLPDQVGLSKPDDLSFILFRRS